MLALASVMFYPAMTFLLGLPESSCEKQCDWRWKDCLNGREDLPSMSERILLALQCKANLDMCDDGCRF